MRGAAARLRGPPACLERLGRGARAILDPSEDDAPEEDEWTVEYLQPGQGWQVEYDGLDSKQAGSAFRGMASAGYAVRAWRGGRLWRTSGEDAYLSTQQSARRG